MSSWASTYDADLSSREHHDVDDFIDVKLNRSRITWDDLAVPPVLRDLADRAWDAMNALVEDPQDAVAVAALEQMQDEYAELFDWSAAIAMDATTAQVAEGKRAVRKRKDAELAEVRRELRAVRDENARLRTSLHEPGRTAAQASLTRRSLRVRPGPPTVSSEA